MVKEGGAAINLIIAILTGLLVLMAGILIWSLCAAASERERLLDRIQAPTLREYRQIHSAKKAESKAAPVDGSPIEMEIEDMAPGTYPQAEEAARRLVE